MLVRGNLEVYGQRGVAIVGSRDASPRALKIAERLGYRFAEAGLSIISGGARGIDTYAHRGALLGNGTTTIVLPFGLNKFFVRKELKDVWDKERVAICSEFPNDADFTGRQAMQRNKSICNLSEIVIIVQIGVGRSGTLGTYQDALAMGKQVFVIDGEDIGVRCGNNSLQSAVNVSLAQIADNGVMDTFNL